MINDELKLREAAPADIPVLVKHRRWMFDDMLATQAVTYTPVDLDEMEPAYRQYLETHLGGYLRAWVVEAEGGVVASGAVGVYAWPPRPGDVSGQAALMHSVYTAPDYRRRGLARRLVEAMLDACRSAGYRTLTLHASQAGRPLYESLGFKQTNEMRLVLP